MSPTLEVKRQPAMNERPPEEIQGYPQRVLIVEDEPELVEPLRYGLNRAGIETLETGDGYTACQIIGERRPDLILLDILLPGLDGWEVCRLIRSQPNEFAASVPIIMLSGLGSLPDRTRGLQLGADVFFPKPYAMDEVIPAVRNLLARRNRQRAMRDELETLHRQETLRRDMQGLLFHELKNQLLVVSGFSQMLNDESAPLFPEKTRFSLRAIQRSSSYLADLANDVLLMGQLESGALELPAEDFDPVETIRQLFILHHAVAHGSSVTLELETAGGTGTVKLNPTAFKVILSGLIDNGVKYSRLGGRVQVTCSRDDAGGLQVDVRDNGPGIPPEEQQRVFDRFYRSGGSGKAVKGIGLGLYIGRTLSRAMGGRLELVASTREGSCFRLSFPRIEASAA
jgi:signal transduction histidine kinase